MQCKQARTLHAPYGREPSELLALMSEYFAGILKERTRAESSSYLKSTNGNATHNSIIVNNKICLSRFPVGRAAPGVCCQLPDSLSVLSGS